MGLLYFFVLIAHVIVGSLILGMAFFAVLAAYRRPFADQEVTILKFLKRHGALFAGAQFVLGVALIVMEPDSFLKNPLIWTKLVLFVLAGLVSTELIDKRLHSFGQAKSDKSERTIQRATWLLLILVLAIVVLGVMAAETA